MTFASGVTTGILLKHTAKLILEGKSNFGVEESLLFSVGIATVYTNSGMKR